MKRQSTRAEIRTEDLKTTRGKPVRLTPRLSDPTEKRIWEEKLADPDSIIVLDLFCGAGGMSFGFEQAGFVIAAGLDVDQNACETFTANIRGHSCCVDISTIQDPAGFLSSLGIPRVDVIVGGPPCQGFSIVGRAKIRSLDEDARQQIYARNRLYLQFVRFVQTLQPSMFVMENVPHLTSFSFSEDTDSPSDRVVAQAILEDFQRLNYRIHPERLYDASLYGVPQTRRRLLFVGSRLEVGTGAYPMYTRPRRTHGATTGIRLRTLADAISDLPTVPIPCLDEVMPYIPRERPDLTVSPDYVHMLRSSMPACQRDLLFDHVVRPVRKDDTDIFRLLVPGGRYRDVPERYRRYELKRSAQDGRHHFSDRYLKLRWEDPCVTITAHMAKDGYRYIYPDADQPRTLSVREAARVQSFPDHFRFAGYRTNQFVHIGNAVPPLLAKEVAYSVAEAIRNHRTGKPGAGVYQLSFDV